MSKLRMEDTIAAVATPPGEGGIAVIRVSGRKAFSLAEKVVSLRSKKRVRDVASHTLHLGTVRGEEGKLVDQALVSKFAGPRSYTGEDVVEISIHGGMVLARRVLELLTRRGARHAEPGEFTRRAFLNGKIDLMQAEAVLDLIKAKSERALESAAHQLSGSLSARLGKIKERLMTLCAHMEAYLDFPDEDIEIYSDEDIGKKFSEWTADIGDLAASFKRGAILREGVMAAIVGKPNVGKSSLFNALLERDRALVSEYAGTTRDRLEEPAEIGGYYVRLVDTAGLTEDPGHPLDRMGMERTHQTLREAQLFLWILDGSAPLDDQDREVLGKLPRDKPVLVVVNKCDLAGTLNVSDLNAMTGHKPCLNISSKTRDGIARLEKEITAAIEDCGLTARGEQITRLRHRDALERALAACTRAAEGFSRRRPLETVVLDVRAALRELRELIGEVYDEDLLDVIFSEFCIGK